MMQAMLNIIELKNNSIPPKCVDTREIESQIPLNDKQRRIQFDVKVLQE
jgi:hypothetical protein